MMPKGLDDVKGIPEFWLDAMLNCYEVEERLQGEDLEMLKHLTDITSDLHENDMVSP
jgi:Nucleosome assembly protein (NAP)